MLAIDHIAVSAETLEAGTEWAEMALGVPLTSGGKHPHMGTHNRLLSLGDLYLEIIAIDPAAPKPDRPRWFDLDHFQGPPRLTNWICRTADLDADLATAPPGTGTATDLQRGDYRWRFAVPASGKLPYDDCFPALIQWQGELHPAKSLRDHGIRLTRLEITHPQAPGLQAALRALNDPRVVVELGPYHALRATFDTPHGPRVLT
jgi:hypothetical protein